MPLPAQTTALLALAGCLTVAPCARAQNGVVVHGAVTTAISEGEIDAAFGGGGGYEWGILRVGGEITRTTRLLPNFVHIAGEEAWTMVTTFLGQARVRLPIGNARVSTYAAAGAGVARVTDAYTVVYIQPGPNPITSTVRRPAVEAGGGVSIPASGVSVDLDARLLRILGDRARSIVRLGVGISVQF